MRHNYRCVMITGASSGLGEEFARQLAGCVDQMILVARREDRLEALAADLGARYPAISIKVIPADLTNQVERISTVENAIDAGFSPDLLVNNAGLGDYGEFSSAEWPALKAMLDLNISALTHLSHLVLPEMKNKGGGRILNVSSLAASLPIPDFAVYAATKAYVSSFSEALRIELAEHRIEVMSLCPGPVKTEFGVVAMRDASEREIPASPYFYVTKRQVVSEALAGLDRGKARIFPGLKIAAAGMILGALPLVVLRMVMSLRPRR